MKFGSNNDLVALASEPPTELGTLLLSSIIWSLVTPSTFKFVIWAGGLKSSLPRDGLSGFSAESSCQQRSKVAPGVFRIALSGVGMSGLLNKRDAGQTLQEPYRFK